MLWLVVFYAVALPLLVLAIAAALRVMPAKGTPWLVHADVGLAWFSALSTMVLVPTDVATTLEGRHPQLLRQWWRVAYWYGFLAMFTVLPFHQEYADSGHFHVVDRCLQSLRNNLIFYAVLAALGAAGLLLLLLTGSLVPANVVGFCIAASNAFGLILSIFVMGYGLVAIPRQLWRTASVAGQKRLLQHRAGVQADKALAARRELNQARAAVAKVSGLFNRRDPLRKYMDQIVAMSAEYEADAGEAGAADEDATDLDFFDRQDLGRLRRRLRAGGEAFRRERELFLELAQAYLEVEDVMTNAVRGPPFRSTTGREWPAFAAGLQWHWRCVLRAWAFRLAAVIAALLSAAVVLAEATISPQLPNLSVFSRALHAAGGGELARSLLTFVMLAYPCAAAYYALFKLGRFGFYMLVPGHTNAYSLLTNALLMCRFAPPLAFNLMAALAMPASKHDERHDVTETVFYHEFGSLMMRQPLIGFEFTTFSPLVLVPYVALLSLNAFDRLAALCTRSAVFEDDWETRSPAREAGARLLATEAENAAAGRPLGLTISPQGGDPEAGRRRSWWGLPLGRRRPALLAADHLAAPTRPPEVSDARSRLSRHATPHPLPARRAMSERGRCGRGSGGVACAAAGPAVMAGAAVPASAPVAGGVQRECRLRSGSSAAARVQGRGQGGGRARRGGGCGRRGGGRGRGGRAGAAALWLGRGQGGERGARAACARLRRQQPRLDFCPHGRALRQPRRPAGGQAGSRGSQPERRERHGGACQRPQQMVPPHALGGRPPAPACCAACVPRPRPLLQAGLRSCVRPACRA